jgi:two-component system response regulator PilR (NtrC family)
VSERRIIGNDPKVGALYDLIDRVAKARTVVLITGESGTGKELVAREIHRLGDWSSRPFVAINCGAIPENLIESELFGHKRGSFTGAVADKPGLFETAKDGTLFLDEIGELPLAMQVKLLRALQERLIRRVGGNDTIKVEARIIAATNRDLEAMVAQGRFREDLFYRLNVINIRVPALRERKSDILVLAEHFLRAAAAKSGKQVQAFSPEAQAALTAHAWPGNVRELENAVERAVTLSGPGEVPLDALPATLQPGAAAATPRPTEGWPPPLPGVNSGPVALEKVLADVERAYLQAAIQQCGGNRRQAASLLGLAPAAFKSRCDRLGIRES